MSEHNSNFPTIGTCCKSFHCTVTTFKCGGAVKVLAGHKIEIRSDNTNTCTVIMTGKSINRYIQPCTWEIYQILAANDLE